jgi:hypothetical protein
VCLIFRQNGGDSLLQEEEDPIPQLFHIPMWIRQKKLFRTRFLRQRFSERRRETNNLRYGTLRFQKKKGRNHLFSLKTSVFEMPEVMLFSGGRCHT